MRLGARVSAGNGLATARCGVPGFLGFGAAAVQYWRNALPLPAGAFGPLLERGIVSSLGWEMVKAATYPQTCAFGVGVLIGYVVGVHGMWIVGIERLALPRRFPTSAKSVDKPQFSYYKFSPIFFTFRSRRPEPS